MEIDMLYTNAHDAICAGCASAPCGVGYMQGMGWKVYDLTQGAQGLCPEFLFLQRARLPIPLSEEAEIIIAQFLKKSL